MLRSHRRSRAVTKMVDEYLISFCLTSNIEQINIAAIPADFSSR
jgi:hypothetical protein